MKRILAAAILICLLLCACGVNAENAAAPDSPTAPATETAAPTEPPTEAPTEAPTDPPTTEELALARIKKILKADLKSKSASVPVEEMLQYPELPTGCEAVALTIALNALGCDLSKTEIAEKYLEYNSNYAIGYCGDPFSNGGAGIWPPGMIKTVENYTDATGAKVYAYNSSGCSLKDLCKFIDAGCPVLVWTTYYMDSPMYTSDGVNYDGDFYMWYDNEHCVTLCGYDLSDGTVEIADPLRGKITVDADRFEAINTDIGGWSMALLNTSKLK
jgi:uncharacterized protein YvpB